LLAHPIDDADGEVGGVVVVEIDFAVGSFFEIRVLPQRLGEAGFAQLLGVDDDVVLGLGLEVDVLEVGGGDLQAVEEQAGGFFIDLTLDQHLHDLHDGELDGVGVFKDGKGEARSRLLYGRS
jgi:hypothetical protein